MRITSLNITSSCLHSIFVRVKSAWVNFHFWLSSFARTAIDVICTIEINIDLRVFSSPKISSILFSNNRAFLSRFAFLVEILRMYARARLMILLRVTSNRTDVCHHVGWVACVSLLMKIEKHERQHSEFSTIDKGATYLLKV